LDDLPSLEIPTSPSFRQQFKAKALFAAGVKTNGELRIQVLTWIDGQVARSSN
jgi:hypothetical protein